MNKKVLITGASGFAGSHLIDYLKTQNHYDITGTVFGSPTNITDGWQPEAINLTDSTAIDSLIAKYQPEWIFHLAALSSPAASFHDNHRTLINNILAEAFLLDAVINHTPAARVLIVGSAEEYGKVDPDQLPINEKQSLQPMSPYAVSKVTQDLLAQQYYFTHKLDIVRVRPFNHTGDRQTSQFVIPAFAEQIAKIEAGLQPPTINVGNLTATRDFSDVKDIVIAYVRALEKGESGDIYNLGSGNETSIQTILDMMLKRSSVEINVVQDPQRMQPSDIPRLRADISKINTQTGWQPVIPLEATITRVLDYWRNKVKG